MPRHGDPQSLIKRLTLGAHIEGGRSGEGRGVDRHEGGVVRSVLGDPSHSAQQVGQRASGLSHCAIGSAPQRNGALEAQAGVVLSSGHSQHTIAQLGGGGEASGVRLGEIGSKAEGGIAISIGRELREQRGCSQSQNSPNSSSAGEGLGVAIGAEGLGEVELSFGRIPQASTLSNLLDVAGAQEVAGIAKVEGLDDELVGHHCDVVVRHTLSDPNGRRSGIIRQDVEHPSLVRIGYSESLASLVLSSLHALLPGAAIEAELHGQHSLAVGSEFGYSEEDSGAGGLSDGHLLLVLDGIGAQGVRIGVAHLWDGEGGLHLSPIVDGFVYLVGQVVGAVDVVLCGGLHIAGVVGADVMHRAHASLRPGPGGHVCDAEVTLLAVVVVGGHSAAVSHGSLAWESQISCQTHFPNTLSQTETITHRRQ
eukprot:scaffold437_cov168-Ochromonas_danica.AAC.46